MNVYIELGVHSTKDKLLDFIKKRGDNWIIHLFEANYLCVAGIENEIKKFSLKNIILHHCAVSNFNGEREFYLGRHGQSASTLFKGKGHVNYDDSIVVNCIDFDKWMRENITKDDYVCMSIDIEGAEYEILPEMIKSGSIDLVHEIEIEFHSGKFRGENREIFKKKHHVIVDFLKNKKFVMSKFHKM